MFFGFYVLSLNKDIPQPLFKCSGLDSSSREVYPNVEIWAWAGAG